MSSKVHFKEHDPLNNNSWFTHTPSSPLFCLMEEAGSNSCFQDFKDSSSRILEDHSCRLVSGHGRGLMGANGMDCKLDSAVNRLWQRGLDRHTTAWHMPLDRCQRRSAFVGGPARICCAFDPAFKMAFLSIPPQFRSKITATFPRFPKF